MKKNDIILLVVGVILITIGLFVYKEKAVEVTPPSKEVGLHQINYSQYEYLLDEGEQFTVFIGATGCSWCEKFSPVLKDVVEEYKLTVYYIDIAKISSKQNTSLTQSNDWLSSNSWGTPTTLILTKEETKDVLQGYNEKDAIVSFFQKNGLISE